MICFFYIYHWSLRITKGSREYETFSRLHGVVLKGSDWIPGVQGRMHRIGVEVLANEVNSWNEEKMIRPAYHSSF